MYIIPIPFLDLRVVDRFWSHVARPEIGCWEWTSRRTDRGYGRFSIRKKNYLAHRVSAVMSGMDVDGWLVCHRCDNRLCVRPDHLFTGTPADNMRDRDVKGRKATGVRTKPWTRARGERQALAKLRASDVQEIRSAYASGASLAELSRCYGVVSSTVYGVVTRRTWTHVA
jgi:hypothetical protein